jgi:lipoprotein-anchoring transpeptidase ErfK/SrfK
VATQVAVTALQTKKDLFVDGIAGRETALALGIWPDENLLVVRTPVPAKGEKDSLGFLLSSVASTGASAPALPANSGSGRRLVFERAGQRVWAVSKNDEVIRSWLVSGSKYNNETAGTHQVYSRSEITTAWNGRAFLKKMVRWLKTEIGAIGFHQIPVHRSDNTVYQTEEELGTRLSGGCQRQAKLDAEFLWSFAKIGTPVVVL